MNIVLLDDSLSKNATNSPQSSSSFNLAKESRLLFEVAIPSVAVQFSLEFIFTLSASMVGRHLGTEALAGFSLASLTGNLTILSVIVGVLTAAEILMPRAFAAEQYEEVGQLAIRSFIMCVLLLIPPLIPLLNDMEWVFDRLGQDPAASKMASEWIKYYIMGVPAVLLYRVTESFLNAQHVVMPQVTGCIISCLLIHPFMLYLLVPAYGFLGSGLAVVITQTCTTIIVFLYIGMKSEHHPLTWPKLSRYYLKKSFRCKPVQQFVSLSLGGVVALSEWWFWETVCFTVGSFGVIPLCVHTIAYNIVPLVYMLPLGISIGLTVRMGSVIASNADKAKQIAIWCMGFTVLLGLAISIAFYVFQKRVILSFTKDDNVIQGCIEIWPNLCVFIFLQFIFGINTGILRALGMQWPMAIIVFGCCWCIAMPATAYFSIVRKGYLSSVWIILPSLYFVMQVLLACSYMFTSWDDISKSIREENFQRSISPKNSYLRRIGLVNEDTALI